MKCIEFEKLEMKYMDGNITDDEKKLMLKHMLKCSKCKAEYEVYSRITADLQVLPLPLPDEDFTAGVMASVATIPRQSKGLLFIVICSIISAVSSVAGFFNLIILNRVQLVDKLSDNALFKPMAELINVLASFDKAMGEIIYSVFAVLGSYRDTITFTALSIAIIGIGVYTALNKSVADLDLGHGHGGIKK